MIAAILILLIEVPGIILMGNFAFGVSERLKPSRWAWIAAGAVCVFGGAALTGLLMVVSVVFP